MLTLSQALMEGIPDISNFKKRHSEIDQMMLQADFFQDQRKAASLAREHQKLGELIELYGRLEALEQDAVDNQAIIDDSASDADLVELAREELAGADAQREELRQEVLFAMIPPDPTDSRNTVVEVRAGAGGDEASLFAGDLFRMYSRFAERRGWKVEQLGQSPSEAGGFKEVTFLVTGDEVFKTLKYESGVHRVQRVPLTESGGRIHTSTATVAVLPEAEEVDIQINPDDLEITVCRASGPGGQGVNTTDSAVQILHKPTGIIVNCADERSQLKNKTKALKVLRSRLLQAKQEEEQAKYAAHRRSQVGTGDRSERIRTYNFSQSRITDHRIGLTAHNLTEVLDGDIDALVTALQEADLEERVKLLLEVEDS